MPRTPSARARPAAAAAMPRAARGETDRALAALHADHAGALLRRGCDGRVRPSPGRSPRRGRPVLVRTGGACVPRSGPREPGARNGCLGWPPAAMAATSILAADAVTAGSPAVRADHTDKPDLLAVRGAGACAPAPG
jgi:hypothetical protein